MDRLFHFLQPIINVASSTEQNPTPLGPPPMVLHNPLPNQGMVETHPLVPQNNATTYGGQPIDPVAHHLMTLSIDVNLQN